MREILSKPTPPRVPELRSAPQCRTVGKSRTTGVWKENKVQSAGEHEGPFVLGGNAEVRRRLWLFVSVHITARMTAPLTGMNDNGYSNHSPQESREGGRERMRVFVCVSGGAAARTVPSLPPSLLPIPPPLPPVVPCTKTNVCTNHTQQCTHERGKVGTKLL